MSIQLYGGAVLLDSGAVARDAACCCGGGGYDCGPCESPVTDLTVDLGTSGWWTDGKCDYCDQPSGEYVLSWWMYGAANCNWLYLEEDVCQIAGYSNYSNFVITAWILGTTSYTWEVQIWFQDNSAPSLGLSIVTYRLGPITNSDCWSEAVGGVLTLSKFSESHVSGLCSGTAPATIDIWQ